MENSNAQNLAERIALLLQENDRQNAGSVSETLERINQRLDRIESQIISQNPKSAIQNPKSVHPSQQKFLALEEFADELISNLANEKACPYEPTGKPCDNCSMCNSRGF